jgi:DNA-binding transcriptional LysR family regulator|tara:strand:- start:1181 stop:2077 length:897 start_codon:yes stop_codon:yes gene_type:complete
VKQLSRIDLNLFVVFEVIYRERNVTRAAEILCLTQPAVSNSLARLRDLLDDPLFVRTPQGMTPTPVAHNIMPHVVEALGLLDKSVSQGHTFVPAEANREFVLSMTDLSESIFLPAIMSKLSIEAPNVRIKSHYVQRDILARSLTAGELDLAIDVPLVREDSLQHTSLLSDRYVCAVHPEHELAETELTLEAYLGLKHMHISNRRKGMGQVDVALHKLGKSRNIVLWSQHYMVAPLVGRDTDLVLTIPYQMAKQYNLVVKELPFRMPSLETHLYWHDNNDAANEWLRGVLQNLVKEAYN